MLLIENLKKNRLVARLAKTKLWRYLIESKAELKKVTWPTRKEVLNYTILIIIISLATATYFGVLDYIFSLLVEQVINKF